MKKQVLFIHGAGGYEEDMKMAASLRDMFGAAFDMRYPKMPDEDSLEYKAWKNQIAKELAAMDGEVILVGHSLGASVLLKYLSEERVGKPVAGLFLVAVPYWGAEDWEVKEYTLREDFASRLPDEPPIFFYHGRDDEVVPFGHLALYEAKLPWATFRGFDGLGHQFGDGLSEVARDIRRMLARADGPESGDDPGAAAMDVERSSDLPDGLGKPARRALAGAGYTRLEQLTAVSEAEVSKLHGMGPKALKQISEALTARDLSFADGPQEAG